MIKFYKNENIIYIIPTISFFHDTDYYTKKNDYIFFEISWIKWTISIKIK